VAAPADAGFTQALESTPKLVYAPAAQDRPPADTAMRTDLHFLVNGG
jgi:hypothetical protein